MDKIIMRLSQINLKYRRKGGAPLLEATIVVEVVGAEEKLGLLPSCTVNLPCAEFQDKETCQVGTIIF